jgi:hypothetical protein
LATIKISDIYHLLVGNRVARFILAQHNTFGENHTKSPNGHKIYILFPFLSQLQWEFGTKIIPSGNPGWDGNNYETVATTSLLQMENVFREGSYKTQGHEPWGIRKYENHAAAVDFNFISTNCEEK